MKNIHVTIVQEKIVAMDEKQGSVVIYATTMAWKIAIIVTQWIFRKEQNNDD